MLDYIKRKLSVTNFSSENNLLTFRLNAPVIIRVKVKRCEQTLLFIVVHYWGWTSLEVKGRWELLLPPCLLITAVQQPRTSSPPFRLKRSSEGVIWMCRAFFTISSCPLAWSCTVSPPSRLDGVSPTHALLQLTSPSSPSRRHLSVPSVLSPVSVWSPWCRPGRSCRRYEMDCLPRGNVS